MRTPPPPHTSPKRSGFAIASLIFGILGGILFALIFGYIALSRIKRSGGVLRGRGLALAGVTLGWLWLGLLLIGVVAAITSGPEDLPADAVCGELRDDTIREVPCESPGANVYLDSEHPSGSDPEEVCPPFAAAYTTDEAGRVECWRYI